MKVVSISNSQDSEVLPIDHDVLLKRLQVITDDFALDYCETIISFIEELLLFKALVDARKSPLLFKHHVEKLNQTQFGKMDNISLYLSSSDPMNKIDELKKETFGITTPTQTSIAKATQILGMIKTRTSDYKAEGMRLAAISSPYSLLADMNIILSLCEKYDTIVFDRLAKLPPNDLDDIEEILNKEL